MARSQFQLLDEPSFELAPIIVHNMFSALDEIRSTGVTILIVAQNTHIVL